MNFESDRCLTPRAPGGFPDEDAAVIQASWQVPERFAEIYDAYFVEIHKYVEHRLGRDIADDLAAETFVAAFRQRQRYDRARGDARAWLYGIATNLVRRHRRQGRPLITGRIKVGLYVKGPRSIFLGESRRRVSVKEIMALPTDPAQLKTRLQALIDPAALKSLGRTPTEGMYDAVRDLLILAPAPPKVRAAAFRLLATFPGIKTLGKIRDPLGREGIGLIVTDPSFRPGGSYPDRFIIDPATSNILAVGNQSAPGNHNTYTSVSAGWTDAAPTLPAQRVQDRQP